MNSPLPFFKAPLDRSWSAFFHTSAILVVGLAAAAGLTHSAHAAAGDYVGPTDGDWNTATNWSFNAVPTTADALTILGPGNVAGALTIDISAPASGGSLNFTDTAAVNIFNPTSNSAQTLTLGSAAANGITTGAGAVTIGSATAGQAVNIALGVAQTWTVGAGGLTVNNGVSGAFGLTKAGTGVLTLAGANTYTGATALSTGTLTITSTGSLGSATTAAGAVSQAAGTLNVSGGFLRAASLSQNSGGSAFSLSNNGTAIFTGAFSIGTDNKSSASFASLTSGSLTAASVFVGRSNYNAATMTGGGSATQGIYVNGAAVNVTGALQLGNGSTNSSANFRVDSGSVTVGGATSVNSAGTGNTRYSVLDINGGTFTTASTSVGGAYLASRGLLEVRNTGVFTTGALTVGGGTQTANDNTVNLLGGSTYIGAGGISLGANNTVPYAINLGLAASTVAPILGASANWSSALNMTLADSTTAGASVVQAAGSTGTAANIGLNGILSGTGGLRKTGEGALALGGVNTYTGATTVAAGALLANGSLAAGSVVNVNGSTAVLGGSGTVNGAVTVSSGSLAPGAAVNTVGQLTLGGGLTLTAGSTLALQIGGLTTAGTDFDFVNLGASALAYGGALNVTDFGSFDISAQAGTYNLLDFGSHTGAFANVSVDGVALTLNNDSWVGTAGGFDYTFTQSDGVLSVAAVPEPSSVALLSSLGLVSLLRLRQRRR